MRFAPLVRAGGTVLDVACGSGRHARALTDLGFQVVALDRDTEALSRFDATEKYLVDLEAAPWPLPGRRFDGIVVTNYLYRALFPVLLDALADDGVLIYETFAQGNGEFGRPSNPAFLLGPGELLAHTTGLRVVAYENGFICRPKPAMVQRICAIHAHGTQHDLRYNL